MLGSVKFPDPDMVESVEVLNLVDKWNANMPQALLSGKLILRSNKTLHSSELKHKSLNWKC